MPLDASALRAVAALPLSEPCCLLRLGNAGAGGNDLNGSKLQVEDQKLVRGNEALVGSIQVGSMIVRSGKGCWAAQEEACPRRPGSLKLRSGGRVAGVITRAARFVRVCVCVKGC